MRMNNQGFTLIEVLIALAIVAVGLMGAIKALEQVGRGSHASTLRLWAGVSAENAIIEARLDPRAREIAETRFACPQAGIDLQCKRQVEPTVHPLFKKISVEVFGEGGQVLAQRVGFSGEGF